MISLTFESGIEERKAAVIFSVNLERISIKFNVSQAFGVHGWESNIRGHFVLHHSRILSLRWLLVSLRWQKEVELWVRSEELQDSLVLRIEKWLEVWCHLDRGSSHETCDITRLLNTVVILDRLHKCSYLALLVKKLIIVGDGQSRVSLRTFVPHKGQVRWWLLFWAWLSFLRIWMESRFESAAWILLVGELAQRSPCLLKCLLLAYRKCSWLVYIGALLRQCDVIESVSDKVPDFQVRTRSKRILHVTAVRPRYLVNARWIVDWFLQWVASATLRELYQAWESQFWSIFWPSCR